jgi:DNA topoisomerase-1
MTEKEREKITDLSKCNFKQMHSYFVTKSEERKAMSKEEKKVTFRYTDFIKCS